MCDSSTRLRGRERQRAIYRGRIRIITCQMLKCMNFQIKCCNVQLDKKNILCNSSHTHTIPNSKNIADIHS